MRIVAILIGWLVLFLHSACPAKAAIQFLIYDPIISGVELSIVASISGLTSSSCNTDGRCFLEGTIRSVGATKYFGQTLNHMGSWMDYISSPEIEYIQSTFLAINPEAGSWSGQLKMRYSPVDEEYKGAGDYELKFRRFSGKSPNPSGDSNTLIVALTAPIPAPTPTATPSPTPTSTPTPTNTISPTSSPTNSSPLGI